MAREFSYSIYDTFKAGLAPDSRFPTNSQYVEELFNAKVHKQWGVIPYVPVTTPITDTLSFPFPRLHKMREITYLLGKKTVKSVNESTWALTSQVIYDANNTGVVATITGGDIWQVVDLGDAYFFHNGIETIFKTGLVAALGDENKLLHQSDVKITTGCIQKGRVWTGGFTQSGFYNNQWLNEITKESRVFKTVITKMLDGLKPNSVMWSSIGGGDLLWLFYPFYGMQGLTGKGYFEDKLELLRDILEKNEMGSRRMPWQGKVLHMKPLGRDHIVVYGEGGVGLLTPQGTEVAFTDLEIPDGINNIGAVGGDAREHIWIDSSGVLWSISSRELSPRRLGYDNYFSSLVGTTLIISFDSNEREFYIDNGTKHYVYTSSGLSEHGQTVTSVVNTKGGVVGFGVTAANMADKEFRLTSNVFDEGRRGFKNLAQVALDISGNTSLFARTAWRSDRTGSFVNSREVAVNREGTVRLNVTANEHKLKLRAIDYSILRLFDAKLHWQGSDKRYIRGTETERSEVR